MRQIELLYFEELSPFYEPVFAFPVLGRLSMRQMTIIGVSAIISWAAYQSSESPLSMIILVLGGIVGFKKFNVKPAESQFLSAIRFLLARDGLANKNLNRAARPHRKPGGKISRPEMFDPVLQAGKKQIGVREVFADPLKPVRLQIRLQTPAGEPIANTKTKVEFDGIVVSTLSTTANGEIEALIIPHTQGRKRLVVFADGYQDPVFEEILAIRNF